MMKMRRSLLIVTGISLLFSLQSLAAEGQQEAGATSAEAIEAWLEKV